MQLPTISSSDFSWWLSPTLVLGFVFVFEVSPTWKLFGRFLAPFSFALWNMPLPHMIIYILKGFEFGGLVYWKRFVECATNQVKS